MFFTKIRGSLYTEIDIFIRDRGSENALFWSSPYNGVKSKNKKST